MNALPTKKISCEFFIDSSMENYHINDGIIVCNKTAKYIVEFETANGLQHAYICLNCKLKFDRNGSSYKCYACYDIISTSNLINFK